MSCSHELVLVKTNNSSVRMHKANLPFLTTPNVSLQSSLKKALLYILFFPKKIRYKKARYQKWRHDWASYTGLRVVSLWYGSGQALLRVAISAVFTEVQRLGQTTGNIRIVSVKRYCHILRVICYHLLVPVTNRVYRQYRC